MPHDYTLITPAEMEDVTRRALEQAGRVVEEAARSGERGGFEQVVLPLDQLTALLGDAYGRGAFMARVHPDPAVRRAAVETEERLESWKVELLSRRDLYLALRAYLEGGEAATLEGERRRLLEHWLRDFRRAGHELPERERDEVSRLRQRLVELEVAFQRNVDEHDDALELTREELEGLPHDYVERLDPGSRPGTYRVSLDYPERYPFLEQARRRDLRRRLEFKSWTIAVEENRPLLEEALRIRRRVAELLGYPSWAAYSMEVKMADPGAVEELYEELVPVLTRKAEEELQAMRALLAEEEGDTELRSWDWRYYDTALRRRDFGVDPGQVAEYFPLDRVLEGMLELTAEVFGLAYRRESSARAWHPDVELYEVLDARTGEQLAWFYADLFPREGKFGHAAAFPLVAGRREGDGSNRRPVSAIVANFTKPTAGRPSLLRHDEVVTLFHELGHILHQSLTTASFARFSGANTEWDFVEAPSQIMEHWTWDAEVLQRFARHHRSGGPIPPDLVGRLVAARDLNVAVRTLRQCYFGLLDLAIHRPGDQDLEAANRRAYRVTGFPFHEGTFFPASFAHLMGGYDAGYYGYLWAKVYGDDMFSRFEEEGVTDPELGGAYRREILEPGGSEDAALLLRRFLGREPSRQAFLRHLGIG